MSVLAELTLSCKSPSGESMPVNLTLMTPTQTEDQKAWSCKGKLHPIDGEFNIYGEDSFQALSLAYTYIAKRMASFIARGYFFYFSGTNEPFLMNAYFPLIEESNNKL